MSAASLPEFLIDELQDPVLEQRAKQKASMLESLYPALSQHAAHPATAMYIRMGAPLEMIPSPLAWCHSMVVSRCFSMADVDTFAFVPFLDMCQHAEAPTANFSSVSGDFELTALRPIEAGEEITISYDGNEYASRRMFELYGFSQSEGSARDAELLHAAVAAAMEATDVSEVELGASVVEEGQRSGGGGGGGGGDGGVGGGTVGTAGPEGGSVEASGGEGGEKASETGGAASGSDAWELTPDSIPRLLKAFDEHRSWPHASAARFGALFDALSEAEAPAPAAMLAGVRWQRKAWPTSLDKDLQDLDRLQQSGGGGDRRIAAILAYRSSRKKQLAVAESVLTTFLQDKLQE